MAGAFIAFTDQIGAAQLDNGLTAVAGGVASHFRNWNSSTKPVGDAKEALGTGQRVMFQFRVDYLASFELEEIPNANVPILDRLIAWLLAGGTCSVTTDDLASAVYATCGLAPGATPQKTIFDRQNLTWKLTLQLVNLAGSPVAMTCTYQS